MIGGHSLKIIVYWSLNFSLLPPPSPVPLLGILCHIHFLKEYTLVSFQEKICVEILRHYRVMDPDQRPFIIHYSPWTTGYFPSYLLSSPPSLWGFYAIWIFWRNIPEGVSKKKFAKIYKHITEFWPLIGGHSPIITVYGLLEPLPLPPVIPLGILCHIHFLKEYNWGSFHEKVCKKMLANYRVMAPNQLSFINNYCQWATWISPSSPLSPLGILCNTDFLKEYA